MALRSGGQLELPDRVDARAAVGATETVVDGTADAAGPIEFSVGWLLAAAASLVALAVLAPGGLYLVGFFGLIIVTHEVAHFAVARRSGMVPTELFWGFGPVVAAVRVGGCRYGIKALSLGGYVKLEGMTPTSTLPDGFDEAGSYRAASHGGRLATILAGPGVNLVLALAAFSAAAVLDGVPVGRALLVGAGDVAYVVVATGDALWVWVSNLGGYATAVLDGSGGTAVPVRFLSPVAQADVSRQAVALGPSAILQWFGILSCAVGALNLLPLPPLDGAHALVAAAEGVLQRVRGDRSIRLDVKRLLPLAYATVGLLLALSLSALVLDLRDLV